ncbi:MAG: hypothetical protein DI636_07975 [Pelagerythrobacter marensis]|nr:MAG: hypothetical protein DI636_07975 [Pelagerythrobacter marensis]
MLIVPGQGVHEELTRAAQFASSGYALRSREKVNRWLSRFAETWPEDPEEIVHEDFNAASKRFQEFMRTQGCEFIEPRGIAKTHRMLMIRRRNADLSEVSIFVNALEAFYRDLALNGSRRAPNPMLIDDWESWKPTTRAQAAARHNGRGTRGQFRGLKYFTELEEEYKPKLHDPSTVKERILAAGATWPERVHLIFSVIADSGCRISEPLELNAWDWWDGSEFGDVIRAPNKSSSGERVKDLLLTPATVDAIRKSFDGSGRGRARRLTMDELHQRASNSTPRWSLENIQLFPRRDGKPFTDWTLRNTHFAKAVRANSIYIEDGHGGLVRPTPHILRHARIDEEVRKLDALYADQDRFLAELAEFADHMHCQVENIYKYAARTLRSRALRYRRQLLNQSLEARQADAGAVAQTAAEKLVERMRA